MIRAASGISRDANSARAAVVAARQASEGLAGRSADFCIAFVSSEHREHLNTLVEAVSQVLETPYVAGCSACGVIGSGCEIEDGPVVGVLAVVSDQLRATPFLFRDEGDRGMTAGVRIGQRLMGSRSSSDLLLVWPDPFKVRPDRLLRGMDAVLGPLAVAGGAASASPGLGTTFQFSGSESATAAVSGLRLGGRFRHVVGVTQGCSPLGRPLRVTRSHENLLLELEGRPALELLREVLPTHLAHDLDRSLHHVSVGLLPDPEAPRSGSAEYLVRNIVTADPDTGVLGTADTVEEGQHVVFVHREADAARRDLARMLEQVAPDKTKLDYRFGLYFNCLARGRSLYGEEGIDAWKLAEALPGVPLIGFFCNAEIGPVQGQNRLFTYAGVLILIAE